MNRYKGIPQGRWIEKTRELVESHPLKAAEVVEVVRGCWDAIFQSKIGKFSIGVHIFPKPQTMGFLLHELVPLEFSARYPKTWRGEQAKDDKDLVHIPDDTYSVEIKTSSHKSQIFGNRSYAQKGTAKSKEKTGYYLAVNFEKFAVGGARPRIRRIRFGWLDHADWAGQKAATGQQARLSPAVEKGKLLVLYEVE